MGAKQIFLGRRVRLLSSTYYSYSDLRIVDRKYSELFDIRQIFTIRTSRKWHLTMLWSHKTSLDSFFTRSKKFCVPALVGIFQETNDRNCIAHHCSASSMRQMTKIVCPLTTTKKPTTRYPTRHCALTELQSTKQIKTAHQLQIGVGIRGIARNCQRRGFWGCGSPETP